MTNRYKNILLIVATLVVLVIVYYLTIAKTLAYKNTYKEKLQEKELLDNASEKLNFYLQKKAYLTGVLKKKNVSAEHSFQQVLLKKITDITKNNKVEVINFDEPHLFKNKDIVTAIYKVDIRGEYFELLSILCTMENMRIAEIVSTAFIKKKDYVKNKEYLVVSIYFKKVAAI